VSVVWPAASKPSSIPPIPAKSPQVLRPVVADERVGRLDRTPRFSDLSVNDTRVTIAVECDSGFWRLLGLAPRSSKHPRDSHVERNWAAISPIRSAADSKAIQERFGHSSITVTLDRYGHLFPSLDEALAERFDKSFTSTFGRSDSAS
jgi:integrase